MGVTPLAGNQPGIGMMALLGAQEGARDPKPTIKGRTVIMTISQNVAARGPKDVFGPN